jgi:signal transduction histidine kinase
MQEALLNVVKHANARRVCIHLAVQDGWLTALVEDDGQGFDLAAVWHSEDQARGLGLLGMQERVALLGGELTIHSQPGQGTRVSIKIPLEKRP